MILYGCLGVSMFPSGETGARESFCPFGLPGTRNGWYRSAGS